MNTVNIKNHCTERKPKMQKRENFSVLWIFVKNIFFGKKLQVIQKVANAVQVSHYANHGGEKWRLTSGHLDEVYPLSQVVRVQESHVGQVFIGGCAAVTSGAYAGLSASVALVLLSRDQQLKARDQDLKLRELDLKKGNSYNQRMLFQQNQQLTAQLIKMNDFLMQQQNSTLRFW